VFTGNSPVALQPNAGHGPLVLEVPRPHTTTYSPGRVIGSSQILLSDNTHSRQTSMPPAGFEPTISAGEWPQTNALYCAATGTGRLLAIGNVITPIIIIIIK